MEMDFWHKQSQHARSESTYDGSDVELDSKGDSEGHLCSHSLIGEMCETWYLCRANVESPRGLVVLALLCGM